MTLYPSTPFLKLVMTSAFYRHDFILKIFNGIRKDHPFTCAEERNSWGSKRVKFTESVKFKLHI